MSAESIYEVHFGRANSSISHQLRYINTVSWIGGNVAVHLRKVDNPERKVISVSLDADTERCIYVASLDIRVEITHFSRWCGSVPAKVPIPKGKLRLMHFPKSTLFNNTEKIVDVPKSFAELDGFCNLCPVSLFWLWNLNRRYEGGDQPSKVRKVHCWAHWYSNTLLGNKATKTNVDVVDKKDNSESKLTTGEVRVPRWRPIICPEGGCENYW